MTLVSVKETQKIDYKVQFCNVLFVRVKVNIMILCNYKLHNLALKNNTLIS